MGNNWRQEQSTHDKDPQNYNGPGFRDEQSNNDRGVDYFGQSIEEGQQNRASYSPSNEDDDDED